MYQEKRKKRYNDGDSKMNRILNSRKRVISRRTNTLHVLFKISMKHNVLWQQCILLLLSLVCVSGKQRFAMEPQNQSAVIGTRVTIPCRIEHKTGILQWTKDNFGLGVERKLSIGYTRYRVIGSDEEGDYTLDIQETTLEDDGLYQCQISGTPNGENYLRSLYAHLIILKPPDPPKITQGPVVRCIEDREVALECVSNNGKPAPEINWIDNNGVQIKKGVSFESHEIQNQPTFNARAILRFRPTRQHHNKTFTCQAQNTAETKYRSTSILLQVQYAPEVHIFIKYDVASENITHSHNKIEEGDTVVMGCEANGNPNNISYKWYINNDQILGDLRNELVLSNISRNLHRATIKCEAYNIIGQSADSMTLAVIYGPSIKVKPQSVEGEAGSLVTMTCVVEGYPSPKITWLKFQKDRFIKVGKSSNLTVTVSRQSTGQYWCRGSIENRGDVDSSATVYIRGPPKITSNQTQYGVEGSILKIECITFSIPKPDYISWTYEGIGLRSFSNKQYAFLEETLGDGMMKSTLIVQRSAARHFGTYNCTVMNPYGMDSMEINVIAYNEGKSLSLELTIISCAFVILILSIMLITMLYHRKSNKVDRTVPEISEQKTEHPKDGDDTSNISDLKLELRQVGGSINNSHTDSETDLRPNLHVTSNFGLPLAGPVSYGGSYETELQRAYRRYSGDFNKPISSLNWKNHTQSTGYVAYVDYSKDYAPPATDSLSGSLSRSIDGTYPSEGSLRRQTSYDRFGGLIGPDVIPYSNRGTVLKDGGDIRYAATCGNPFLRGVDSLTYKYHVQTNITGKHAPLPYLAARNTNLHVSPGRSVSPAPPVTPRPKTGSIASTNNGAQPQVPKPSSLSTGALHVLPPSNKGIIPSNQKKKGNGAKNKALGTHI